ncbi:acyl-coenzyme A thioesterase 9, mitochondrial-like [Watersipora subatra]|uniref:acyl-coenzyme A thioesterase 9, mitochondrial-like n=1 Tax=Watersipora subatra TaxID=2589382 RepID=UPI00355C8FD0
MVSVKLLSRLLWNSVQLRKEAPWGMAKRFYTTSEPDVITMKQFRKDMLKMMSSLITWIETTDKEKIMSNMPTEQSQLPTMSMADSLLKGVIPLSISGKERLTYLTPYKDQVRFGRLLEDLDTFAVACCYKHNESSSHPDGEYQVPRAIWTLLVDRIDLAPAFRQVSADRDILLSGHVTWVGKSSIEATIDVSQKDLSGQSQKLIEAVFLMVAKNPINNSSVLVNPLKAATEQERAILAVSESHQKQRKLMADESLLKTAPSEMEQTLIHEIFLSSLDPSASTFKARIKPADSMWMEDTTLKTVRICFPEQKNLYNKIFGGFLMRQAFELAWANACIYSKNRCITVAVDDIIFKAPVAIGSFLYFSSQVAYTENHQMQVRVYAEVRDPETGASCTTNEFHFTLETADGRPVPTALPKTYAESMIYLDSRRRFEEAMLLRRQQTL